MTTVVPTASSSKETTNYARLCRVLVDAGTQALRDTFDTIHAPPNLHTVLAGNKTTLQSLRTRKIINATQWGKLFPAIPSSVCSKNFDTTLLVALLRNLCGLRPPAAGWDTLPAATDLSLEADIARVKYFRNAVYAHAEHASVDDATFNTYWQDIQDTLVRLGGVQYRAAIDNLETECMDPEIEDHFKELLNQWRKDEENIKDELKEIGTDIKNVMKKLEDLSTSGLTKRTETSDEGGVYRMNESYNRNFGLPATTMISFKMILGLLAIAVIGHYIALNYYPLFCNNPDECKQATDEFFGILSDIPQEDMEFFGNVTSAHIKESRDHDHGTEQKNQDAEKKGAFDFTKGGEEVKGEKQKAETTIKSLKFASYEERNLCDLKKGIPPEEYDVAVDEIADRSNMPENLKNTIKRAKNFTERNVFEESSSQFKAADGNLFFALVDVNPIGEVLDMAYSLHSVEYELMPKQRQPDNADKQENGKSTAFDGISMELRADFLAYCHKQAINGFLKHCDFMS